MMLERRGFLVSLAMLATAPPRELFSRVSTVPGAAGAGLAESEKASLAAFCELLIPADEFPGAGDSGVPEFIEKLLSEAHPEWFGVYRSGLRAIDASSRRLYRRDFSGLSAEEQTELVQRCERGDLSSEDWSDTNQRAFFSLVLSHTMTGYYAHPQWGGNKGKRSWEMIGYDDWWV
jgi:gluconate 2-dehydrogenase gamma chain